MTNDDELLLYHEVVELVRLSRSTVWRLARTGMFPAPLMFSPRSPRWKRSHLERWMEQKEIEAQATTERGSGNEEV